MDGGTRGVWDPMYMNSIQKLKYAGLAPTFTCGRSSYDVWYVSGWCEYVGAQHRIVLPQGLQRPTRRMVLFGVLDCAQMMWDDVVERRLV